MNLKPIIILAVLGLLGTASFSSQPLGHIVAGKYAWKAAGSFADSEWKQAKPFIQPMAAIGSHMVMDKLISEAYLGDWQVGIGIVRAFTGYFVTPEKEQGDYLQYAFWALLPDILQKGLGWNFAHPEIGGPKVFTMDRDNNDLLEEMFLASLIFRVEVKF